MPKALLGNAVQEFGKTKIYIPQQEGLEVLSKEVSVYTCSHGAGCCPA